MLEFVDHRRDPAAWAQELEVSREAIDLYLESDVIDLHVDSFIWTRIFGYDLTKRHGEGPLGPRFLSQVDFPRALEAGLTGATWIITTNPLRVRPERTPTFLENLRELRAIFDAASEHFAVVRNAREYRAARAAGKHGAFIGIQGGNALDSTPEALDQIPDDVIVRITIVHLSNSTLGATSSPLKLRPDEGLTNAGREYVKRLNAKKIFVDLAHVSKKGFWDAIEVHDPAQPLLVTHTGVEGVLPHWRNLDDDQVKKVADLGGTIGIMFQSSFLEEAPRYDLGRFTCKAEAIVRHAEHVRDLVGDDFVSIGSDFDGMITPPEDLPSVLELPRLAHIMLERGWRPESVQKALGRNFLRVVEALRG